MRYRISEIKIGPEEFSDRRNLQETLRKTLEKKLRKKYRKGITLSDIEIIRESIDARHKPDVKAVYTLDFDSPDQLQLPAGGREEYLPVAAAEEIPLAEESLLGNGNPSAEEIPLENGNLQARERHRPVIAGFGPCGIFAALILAEAGCRPIVLERGRSVEDRMEDVRRFWEEGILDPESNVQFGEGGAGTFSDGKLTTGIKDIRIRKVLQTFVEAGADPEILYQHRPHIGTDRLRQIIPKIRQRIQDLGGEIRFGTRLDGLETEHGYLTAILVSHREDRQEIRERIPADDLVLAIGHSARDTFRMLKETGLAMEQKPFSIGVRIEHPQEMIDAAQYGDPDLAKYFGPAVYKLNHRCENGRGVYTFCMCPGGQVINASSEEEGAVCNGMSLSARDSGTANSGLLVDVRTSDFGSDDPLAGVEFQRKYEKLARLRGRQFQGGLPKSDYRSFRASVEDPVRACLPAFASDAILEAMPHLGRKLKGFDAPDAVLTAVETRSSSPVRILRDEEMQSPVRGLIPAGEGPGYAGGIVSAAVDGIRAAEQILRERARR